MRGGGEYEYSLVHSWFRSFFHTMLCYNTVIQTVLCTYRVMRMKKKEVEYKTQWRMEGRKEGMIND